MPLRIVPHSTARKSSVLAPSPSQRQGVSTAVDEFRRILRALRLAARETHATAGISAAQLFVLQIVGEDTDASLSQIAARTMTDRTSVAAVVERLVAARLVLRAQSPIDRRRASVSITAKGRAALRRAPTSPAGLLVAGLEMLDRRELTALASGLTALTRAMGLSQKRPGMLFEDGDDVPRRRASRPPSGTP